MTLLFCTIPNVHILFSRAARPVSIVWLLLRNSVVGMYMRVSFVKGETHREAEELQL